jgi:hypothetical protein
MDIFVLGEMAKVRENIFWYKTSISRSNNLDLAKL